MRTTRALGVGRALRVERAKLEEIRMHLEQIRTALEARPADAR